MRIDIRTKQFGRHFSCVEDDAPLQSPQDRRRRRAALFAETPYQRVRRLASIAGVAMTRLGVRGLAGAVDCLWRERAIGVAGLPDPACAAAHPQGLCGLIENPTPELLMEGYARGLHAAAPFGRLTWWSPRNWMAVAPEALAAPGDAPGRDDLKLALDREFDQVLKACGQNQRMSPRVMHLFAGLHDMGFAHSLEVRSLCGRLVAGAWGLALGRVFITLGVFGEGQETCDLVISALNRQLPRLNFVLHAAVGVEGAARLGFEPMPRDEYFSALIANSGYGRLGRWQIPAKDMMQPRAAA